MLVDTDRGLLLRSWAARDHSFQRVKSRWMTHRTRNAPLTEEP